MQISLHDLYSNKGQVYFSNIRQDIISLIKGKGLKILEIGCGNGATLIELKRLGKACEIVGIEINEEVLKDTKHFLDGIVIGNIEDINLEYRDKYFDVIIFADVLEHLVNPWKVVKEIKRHLKSSGILIASIPNIRQYKTVYNILVNGDFKYENMGILDKTHLRFFCKKNIIDLFKDDYKVDIKPIFMLQRGKRNYFNKITFKLFESFITVQYIVIAKGLWTINLDVWDK